MASRPEPVLFEAVCTPPLSFTRSGFRVLAGVALFASLLPAGLALSWGAWPVMGFLGAELALVFGLILWHARRSTRVSETLLLAGDSLRIARTDARGRRESFELDAYWVRVLLHEDAAGSARLLVAQREREIEIGRCLGAEDRRALAGALREALGRYRAPVFDNPQLR
ncbi:MAG TPA: DUF2244 domain-containing protein [Acetobacteraceae bacterium]|nr:DUF2244 domain-containing protein [Acetobacteraceae bacterium]